MKLRTCRRYKRLLWEEMEGGFFIYDPGSGRTHVLNQASAYILRLLRVDPMSLDQLQDELAQTFQPEDAKLFVDQLEYHIAHLQDLVLVVPEGRVEV